MAALRFTILGCGSSGGVPRIGGHWGACDPENPKNRRRRCSVLVERETSDGTTRVLIDTSPDMREQLLQTGIGELDAVVYTHAHADHTHGLDDLRMIVINMRRRLPVWADGPTKADLLSRFSYVFETPEGSAYPPICEMNDIEGEVEITGAGGPIRFAPLPVEHGGMTALGFRIGDLAYMPDVSAIPEGVWPQLYGLKVWILDALRYTPHPSHANLEQALAWIAEAQPEQAVLTNLHVDLDYETLKAETPAHVTPAYDGLTVTLAD